MRHPSEYYIKFLLLKHMEQDAGYIIKSLENLSILTPKPEYIEELRSSLAAKIPKNGFYPEDRLHAPSMRFLRNEGVFDLFFQGAAAAEAMSLIIEQDKRSALEIMLLGRMPKKETIKELNKKHGWHLTTKGAELFEHFFWNINLLSWDDWGRFLFNRTANYERYLYLLKSPPDLVQYHLSLEHQIDSKRMVQSAQEIAFFNLKEISLRPGTQPDKVKGIGILTKAVLECHYAITTTDGALDKILKQISTLRLAGSDERPKSIHDLAPGGNYSESGVKELPPGTKAN